MGDSGSLRPPITTVSAHQEEDFLRPSSREEAQKLWEMERLKMRQVLDKQQKQMVEDYQWLRQEEKSLVSGHKLGGPSSCTVVKVVEEPLQAMRLLFMAGKPGFPWRNTSSSSQTSCTPGKDVMELLHFKVGSLRHEQLKCFQSRLNEIS